VCTKKKERCPYCLGTNLRPKGWNRKKTKRRLKCSNCKKHITTNGKSWFIDRGKIELINALLLERLSLRGICRVVKISLSWLLPYISKLYDSTPDDLNYRQDKNDKNKINLQLIDSELDEMWSFVGKKKNKQWIWIALDRKTRQVIAFHIGDRSQKSAQKLWDNLPNFYKENGRFYTDDWDAYKAVFPPDRHVSSKIKKDTNHIERLNLTIRNRCSRLVRKSLSFSKKLEHHIGALKYFFCHYNLEQQQLWDKYKSAQV
jgi:IS1 family transposase/transposase-like protein